MLTALTIIIKIIIIMLARIVIKYFSLHVPLLFMALLMMMILSCGAGNQKSAVPCSRIEKVNSTDAEHLNVGTIACLQGIHINLTRYMTTD